MKKSISYLLITILVIDLSSCSSYKLISGQENYRLYQDKKSIDVIDVYSRPDSLIVFNEKYPGKLTNNQVSGLPETRLPFTGLDSVVFNWPERNVAYIISKGVRYKIITQDPAGFIGVGGDTARIPYSEIVHMKIKKKDPVKTTLFFAGAGAAITGVILLVVAATMNEMGPWLFVD